MITDKYIISIEYNCIKINDRYTDMEIEEIKLNQKQIKILYGFISLYYIDNVPFDITLEQDMNIKYNISARYLPNDMCHYVIEIYKLFNSNIINHIIITSTDIDPISDFLYDLEYQIQDDIIYEDGYSIDDVIYDYMLLYTL